MLLQKVNQNELATMEPKQIITQSVEHVKSNWFVWIIILIAGYFAYPKDAKKSYRKPIFRKK